MSMLGIDLGTTGCKAGSFSADGACLASAYRENRILHPREGWAELDSAHLWDNVRDAIREVAAAARRDPVTALCVSSFGEAVTPVTRSRRILANSILCTDVRGAEYADALARDIGQEAFYRINPNILGPQYSLPKLLWLKHHEPDLVEGADYFLLAGDLVAFMLGCEPVTANSLANRTLLFDLGANDWSDRLLNWGGIGREKLGRVEPGGTVIGTVSDATAADLGLPKGVQVVTGGHDQCCNALGSGCIEAGRAVCGIGTFECITPVYGPVQDPLRMLALGLNIEHHVLPGMFVSFIYNQAGSLIKWFRETFAAADVPPDGADSYEALNRELPPEPTRLLVLPHFEPPLSPRHIPDSAGAILGLRTGTARGEILKAIMECETLYFADSIDALRDLGIDVGEFVATGGGSRSDAWLQIKADALGVPFVRPRIAEGSLLGAAMLAGLATGVFRTAAEGVARFVRREKTFEPDGIRHRQYREKLELYRKVFPAIHGILRSL